MSSIRNLLIVVICCKFELGANPEHSELLTVSEGELHYKFILKCTDETISLYDHFMQLIISLYDH